MRRWVVGIVSVLAALAFAPAAASARTVDAKCTAVGNFKIAPGVTQSASPQSFTVSGGLIPASSSVPACPGGVSDTVSATLSGTLNTDSMYCTQVLAFHGNDATGGITIAWPDGTSSVLRMWLAPLQSGDYTLWDIGGKVLSGRLAGDRVRARVVTTSFDHTCLGGPIQSLNWSTKVRRALQLQLRPFTFSTS